MSTYITENDIRNDIIRQQFKDGITGNFDATAFTTEIEYYLNSADNKLISHVNGRPSVNIADIPTYADGMHQDLIDLMIYYVYYKFFR
jgi:hypothetical protein